MQKGSSLVNKKCILIIQRLSLQHSPRVPIISNPVHTLVPLLPLSLSFSLTHPTHLLSSSSPTPHRPRRRGHRETGRLHSHVLSLDAPSLPLPIFTYARFHFISPTPVSVSHSPPRSASVSSSSAEPSDPTRIKPSSSSAAAGAGMVPEGARPRVRPLRPPTGSP